MPNKQQHKANVRLSAIDTNRLRQLIELHNDTESNVIRDALTLKWYVDIGISKLQDINVLMREANILTNFGQNDPETENIGEKNVRA